MLKYTDYDIVFSEIPDETTLAINISNCPNHCPGCHSPQLMEDIGIPLTETSLRELMDKYGSDITCVCFMGGDSEPADVALLAHFIHKKCPSIKTGWYSGKQELPNGFNIQLFNYIKLGPYVSALGALKSPTTNQRLYKFGTNGEKEDITSRFWKQL